MESNKSKGVEDRAKIIADIMDACMDQNLGPTDTIALASIYDKFLAHPQQSEGVEGERPLLLTCLTGLGSAIAILKECHVIIPEEHDDKGAIEDCKNNVQEAYDAVCKWYDVSLTDKANNTQGVEIEADASLKSQPSEPAALKEFYCIGDKDNLFQCEEQCEDCKKGAALKDGEIKKVIERLWEKRTGGSLSAYRMSYAEFYEALKEFAALLTNHKS